MKGYNNINLLKRMIDMQEVFKQAYKPGMSIEWIFHNVIYPRFKISRKTFYKWVNYPAASELKRKLNDTSNSKNTTQQTTMEFPKQ
ncbi:MAG: hypothetical protein LC134_01910 [Chitinophagales bacterium]|nr:hypothetical protein [Chitinophagales bacterium]